MAQSISDIIKQKDTLSPPDYYGEQNDPIIRLDRALQRIFFALENNKRTNRSNHSETQEFMVQLDHLIGRVRNTLTEINAEGDL